MNNQFSENLKRIRKEHNLSQEQLADELGVSRQAISKWESSLAYPEMDKIIALCDKFNLNIDDLLHRDIKEIKDEEETKKSLNKSIEDFLKFITDTINLFGNMSFKSKIKCLLEQGVIIFLLFIVSLVIVQIGSSLVYDIFAFLPNKIAHFLNTVLNSILTLFCLISSVVILTHVFKTRYLDYYNKLKKNISEDSKIEAADTKEEKEEIVDKKNKILFQKNENKIIIRDPKHSEYRFINGLFKFIIGIIKFFALYAAFFILPVLVTLFIGFVLCFLIYKTGYFFIGSLITILSSATIMVIFLLLILNFVFNRKNEKKKMIWSFIIAVILLGCGLGLTFVGTLDFEIIENDPSLLKQEKIAFSMQDDIFFDLITNTNIKYIDYVEKDIDNIEVEYKINEYCSLDYHYQNVYDKRGIYFWTECNDPIKITKDLLANLNKKKITSFNTDISDVVIYASKKNIEQLKNNESKYYNNQEISYYEKRVDELEKQIEDYEEKFIDYETEIEELNEQIREYKEVIESSDNQ